jgi:hypothetical protein
MTAWGGNGRKRNQLHAKIELAVGMKVMVTNNIETDLVVTNGARGEIDDTILDPNEPPIGDGAIVESSSIPPHMYW